MDKHRLISIRVNGKKQPHKKAKKENWGDSYQEQAAALEGSLNKDAIPSETEKEVQADKKEASKTTKIKKKMNPVFKMFLIAAVSAVFIGITVGFIMLRMFAGMEQVNNPENGNIAGGGQTTVAAAGQEQNNMSSAVPLEAFVLQGGVFSTLAKAEEWQRNFTNQSFSTVIWERDNQFFLFAGVGSTEQEAKENAGEMISQGLEIYVKQWQAEAAGGDLAAKEKEWIKAFPALWTETLAQTEVAGDLSTLIEKWDSWIAGFPEKSSQPVGDFKEQADIYIQMLGDKETSQNQLQVQLLKVWMAAEKLAQN